MVRVRILLEDASNPQVKELYQYIEILRIMGKKLPVTDDYNRLLTEFQFRIYQIEKRQDLPPPPYNA